MTNVATSEVEFSAGSRTASGYLAEPAEAGPFPGVLVLQEFWGLNDHIKDVTRRCAREGFLALAPDIYDGRVTTDPAVARQWLTALDQAATLDKLRGAAACLGTHPKVARGHVGTLGFCMGGFLALNLACNSSDIRATAAFYGRIPPNEALGKIKGPLLYVFGEKDHHLPVADVDRLEQFLKAKTPTDRDSAVLRYKDADHAFMNDTRPEVFRSEDAQDAWRKAIAFLKRNL